MMKFPGRGIRFKSVRLPCSLQLAGEDCARNHQEKKAMMLWSGGVALTQLFPP